ncbi:hypothetical protein [Marinibacterium profundimaris]|uniref:Uncharacterized protein n=1 Tax=Marinibacterium profundimaris TaxID=1679460 RepID=A0A225NRW9_9RHOB|nr:hypothetical protein [Marinibacterium profundimaris]OWU77595.1 hypothetical protein ATO3_02590 [Marinibacterium profundimaris]
MTGFASLVGGDFSASGAPYLSADPRLTPGTLILTDLTNSETAPGVPDDGGAVHNIAWREAAGILGGGNAASLAGAFNNTFTAPYGAFERTSKGALYGVVSNTNQNGQAARLNGAQPIIDYVADNPTREFAVFLWVDIKRTKAAGGNYFDFGIGSTASWAGNRLFTGSLSSATGAQRQSVQASSWNGSPSGSPAQNQIYQLAWGNIPPYNSLQPDIGHSVILYQYHLIDVALSGMTYAELDALDAANYAAYFGAGGRYAGDTVSLNLANFP